MVERTEDAAVENFTALVKSSFLPLPAFPETHKDGSVIVGTSSSILASVMKDSASERRRSPRQDSVISNLHTSSTTAPRLPERYGTILNSSAVESTVAYTNSSIGTGTRTRSYASSGTLLRRVDYADSSIAAPSPPQLTSLSQTSTSPPPSPDTEKGEELHFHDFCLHTSASSARRESSCDQTTSLPPVSNGTCSSPSANKLEGARHQQKISLPLSQMATSTANSSVMALRAGQNPSPSPKQALNLPVSPTAPIAEVLPPRQMVRRNLATPPTPPSLVTERRVTAERPVHESNSVLVAGARSTSENAVHDRGDTTCSYESVPPTAPVETATTDLRSPADLSSPSLQGNAYTDIEAAPHAIAAEAGLSATGVPIRETFSIPRYCPDDLLRGEDKLWCPGKPLRIAYITWNMANKKPRINEVSAYCIHPNAHLIVVGTQENGPYIGSNKRQNRWAKTIGDVCLSGQYDLVGKHHMWAVQMLVFARKRDVAKYVSCPHSSHVKTGLLHGLGGNKGGVAVGLVLSLTPKFLEASHRATAQWTAPTTVPSMRDDRLSLSAGSIQSSPTAAAVPNGGAASMLEVYMSRPSSSVETSATGLGRRGKDVDDDVPSLPAASGVQRNTDAKDVNSYHRRLQVKMPTYGNGDKINNISTHHNIHCHNGGGLDSNDDGVFSPAEMVSQNASVDLSHERHRRRKRNHRLRHHSSGKNSTSDVGGSGASSSRNKHPKEHQHSYKDLSDAMSNGDTPSYMSLLFITAHLAAHQGAVRNRNKDYREIVHGLRLGCRGPHKQFFKQLLRQQRVLNDMDEAASDNDTHLGDESSSENVMPLSLPVVSAIVNRSKMRRDVTEEFDLTFFGGDLNYRINGTRKAIEYVIRHHRDIRTILINNDQLSLERARGTVFQRYQEGNLLFRPTYKYEVSPNNGSVTLDEYNFSRKKDRMPAYCDRVLFKKKLSSAARRIAIRLYTDVPNVRTSDHRPVVALFDVGTRAHGG